MSEEPITWQPYPTLNPWVLLSSYVTNNWQARGELSSFTFMGRIVENEVHLKLRTRRGTAVVITESLPPEFCPRAVQVLPISATGYPEMQVTISPAGEIRLFGDRNSEAADGNLLNAVLHCSYVRGES